MPLRAKAIGKGHYQIDGTVKGERVRRRIKCRNQREADEETHQIERDFRRQLIHGPESVVTFHFAAAEFVQQGGESRFLPKLMHHFRRVKTIKSITGADVREAAPKLYPDCKPSTWNRQVIAPASAVINFAHGHGWCNPIRIKLFTTKKVDRPYADFEWLAAFRIHATSPEIRALATFMFCTGARVGEAIGLQAEDVDLGAGTALLRDTKNGEDRACALPAVLVEEMSQLPENPVFGFIDRQGHRRQWDATIARAGIRRLTAHEAGRHAFGRIAKQVLGDGLEAAIVGGWKSRDLYESTYSHTENRAREVASAIEAQMVAPKIRRVK